MSHDVVAGVDIGGTKIAGALVDADGKVTRHRIEATPAEAVDVVDTAASMLEALDPPTVAGVGSAGVIDPPTGAVISATDAIRNWAGTKLRDELQARTGLRVAVDNDVHAHARGELWLGAARGHATVLFVAVGTGIGASLVIDGHVYHGSRGVAGTSVICRQPTAATVRAAAAAVVTSKQWLRARRSRARTPNARTPPRP